MCANKDGKMNDRIKELMNEAVRFHWDHDGQAYEAQVHPEDLEYFAELIVRECVRLCNEIEVVESGEFLEFLELKRKGSRF